MQLEELSGIKTHTSRFCRCIGRYKALGLNAQTSQARFVLVRPRALYFHVKHKTGSYAHITIRIAAFHWDKKVAAICR